MAGPLLLPFVVLVIIRMKVPSEERMESLQTIASLSGSIGNEKGCRHFDFNRVSEEES